MISKKIINSTARITPLQKRYIGSYCSNQPSFNDMGVLVPMAVDQFLKTRTMDKGNARIITTTINALNINRKSSPPLP